jgi:isopentenyldiphosphate isomerase
VLAAEDIKRIKLAEEEISEYKFVSKKEAIELVSDRLSNRLIPCFKAIEKGVSIYLEGGREKS